MQKYFQHQNLLVPPVARAAYSDRTAWILAECSRLAYLKFEKDPNQLERGLEFGHFRLLRTFNTADTQGFLAKRGDLAVLAFRGTEQTGADIRTDLNCRFYKTKAGYVHKGFYAAYQDVAGAVRAAVQQLGSLPLYVTGHSLGGALATVAAWDLESDSLAACYTFGSPRVGDGDLDGHIKAPVYRVVNSADIVPHLPFMAMSYQHVGSLYYLTRQGKLLRSPSSIRVLLRYWAALCWRGQATYEDHFIAAYCAKLASYALSQNQIHEVRRRRIEGV